MYPPKEIVNDEDEDDFRIRKPKHDTKLEYNNTY